MRKSPYGIYGQLEGRPNLIGKPKLFATTYDEQVIENMPTTEQAQAYLSGSKGINGFEPPKQKHVPDVPRLSLTGSSPTEQLRPRPLSELMPRSTKSALDFRYEYQNQFKGLPELPLFATKQQSTSNDWTRRNPRHTRSVSDSEPLSESTATLRPVTPVGRIVREPWQGASGVSAQLTPIRDLPVTTITPHVSTPSNSAQRASYFPYRAADALPTPESPEQSNAKKPFHHTIDAPATPKQSGSVETNHLYSDVSPQSPPTFLTPDSPPANARQSSPPPPFTPSYEHGNPRSQFSWTTQATSHVAPATPATCTTIDPWGSPAFTSPLIRKPVNPTYASRFSWTTYATDTAFQETESQQPQLGAAIRRLDWLDMSSPAPPARTLYGTPDSPKQPPQIPPRSHRRSNNTSGDFRGAIFQSSFPSHMEEESGSRFSWTTYNTDVTVIADSPTLVSPYLTGFPEFHTWRTYGVNMASASAAASKPTSPIPRTAVFGRPLPLDFQLPQRDHTSSSPPPSNTSPISPHRRLHPIHPATIPTHKPLPTPPSVIPAIPTIPPTPLEAELAQIIQQRTTLDHQLRSLKNATAVGEGWERQKRRKEEVVRLEREVAKVKLREHEVGIAAWRAARRSARKGGGEGGLWVRREYG